MKDNNLLGVNSLLNTSLKLKENDTLYVVFQSKYTKLVEDLEKISKQKNINIEKRKFNIFDFKSNKFPKTIFSELENSNHVDGIVLLIEWSDTTTGGRLKFLKKLTQINKRWKIASMPGMVIDSFKDCIIPTELESNCLKVFELLNIFEYSIITTYNNSGHKAVLKINLGDHTPKISSGIINEGKWGNVPSGETFCLPNINDCNGSIYLRGSIPNYVFEEDEWVYLEISNGILNLNTVRASNKILFKKFIKLFCDNQFNQTHENSTHLAELGVGTNKSIRKLTGKPLFDEKKAGTIHLGFGSNDQFFGPISCEIHHDLVFTNVEVKLENKSKNVSYVLINNNELLLDSKINITKKINNKKICSLSDKKFSLEKTNVIVTYKSTRNRVIKLKIDISSGSLMLYDLLNRKKDKIPINEFSKFDKELVLRLCLHEIITVKDE